MPDMPKTVRIGHRTYKIEPFSPPDKFVERGAMGAHSYEDAIIKIDTSTDSVRKAEVMLHELLHGFWAVGSLKEDNEEIIITVLAKQMVQSLQDNPELWKWITRSANA